MSRVRSSVLAWSGALAVCLLVGTAGARAQYVVDQDRFRQNTEPFSAETVRCGSDLPEHGKEREKARRGSDDPVQKTKVNVEEVATWLFIFALAAVGVFMGMKAVGHYLSQSNAAVKVTARERALNDPWVQARLAQQNRSGRTVATSPPAGQ